MREAASKLWAAGGAGPFRRMGDKIPDAAAPQRRNSYRDNAGEAGLRAVESGISLAERSLGPTLIPYFKQPTLSLGPLTVHGFGLLVACGVFLGTKILQRRAAEQGVSERAVMRFVSCVLIGGFLGAHLVDRIVYFPSETASDPLSILRFWEGLSSFGGFLGGTIGALLFFVSRAEPKTAWTYVESFAYAFPFGWSFGRLGCFVAYDHPGRATGFALGQMYKDRVIRHNLGLEEAIYTAGIALLFYLLGRTPRFPGFYLGLFLVLYAPFRFGVDFLRIVDVRYGGLTPGQYGCVALVVLAGAILAHRRVAQNSDSGSSRWKL